MSKPWKIAYYISTVLISVGSLLGAYFELSGNEMAVGVLTHLGYPLYVNYILGVAKILGVIGLWQNKIPFLREWAYAGFYFDLILAGVSHLAVGDGLAVISSPLINLILLTVSYVGLRKKLGTQ